MDFRERRVAPGRSILPWEVMSRQRYYEAYGTPYEMEEFYSEEYANAEGMAEAEARGEEGGGGGGGESDCVGHEVKLLEEIRRTPLPMGRKRRARELGYLSMSDHKQNLRVGARARRSWLQFNLSLKRHLQTLGSFLSWLLGGWNVSRIRESLGSSAASYFSLLQSMYLLNFILFVVIFSFVAVPQLVHPSVATQVPSNFSDHITLVVDGQGQSFEFSILYLGYFHSNTSSILGNVYKFPVVYLTIMFWAIVTSFIWLLLGTRGLRYAGHTRITERPDQLFSWRVLTSWNHSLHSPSTVDEKQADIAMEMKALVKAEHKSLKAGKFHWCQNIVRVATSCFVIVWIAGGGAAIFFTVRTLRSDTCGLHYLHDNQTSSAVANYILLFRIALVVTTLNWVFPILNSVLGRLEAYRPHTTTTVGSIRLFLLYLTNVSVLVYALLSLNTECVCQSEGYCCWETRVGQEVYRLFWLDLGAELLTMVLTDFLRGFLVRFHICCRLSDWIGYQEFNISNQTLRLMYSQVLVWFGVFFCPLLPLLAGLRFSLLFLLKSWSSRLTNRPPSLLYRRRASLPYFSTVLLGLLLALMVPLGWTVTQLSPSRSCGPFRHVSHMTDTLTNEIRSWTEQDGSLKEFGFFVQGVHSSAVAIPLLFLISLFAVYFMTKSRTLEKKAKDLLVQSDADCRNSHNTLLRAVAMIPPYDPVLFDADPSGYGEFMEIHPHNQQLLPEAYPTGPGVQGMGEVVVTEGPVQDYMYYYDEQAHMPRQVHLGENDIDEPAVV